MSVFSLISARAKASGRRSPKWPKVRRLHLLANPRCAACGRTVSVEAHHLVPVQIAPEKELDPANLLTLCGGKRNCHLSIGHGFNWRSWRPDAVELARNVRESAVLTPESLDRTAPEAGNNHKEAAVEEG